MMRLVVLFIFSSLLAVSVLYAQVPFSKDLDFDKWYLRSQGYKITQTSGLTLGVYEYSIGNLRVLETPVLLRVDLTKDISLMGGTTFDFYQRPEGFSTNIDAAATFGIQYEVNPNTYIQGLFNYQILGPNTPYNYKFDAPSSFNIRTGFKF